MRSNGLHAARFAVLRDVDQLVSPRLLELLRDAGIAAYARQRAGHAFDPTSASIVDRLWVDAERVAEAAALVDEHLPVLMDTPVDSPTERLVAPDDSAFDAIVAQWSTTAEPPVGAWPAQEDLDPSEPSAADVVFDDPPVRAGGRGPRLVRRATDSPDAVGEDDEGFVPPTPPPLPPLQRPTRWALTAMAVGVGGLLLAWLLGIWVSSEVRTIALLLTVGGAVTLLLRMRDKLPPEEGGPDDGAVL